MLPRLSPEHFLFLFPRIAEFDPSDLHEPASGSLPLVSVWVMCPNRRSIERFDLKESNMRLLSSLVALVAAFPALADDFQATAPVTAATVYSSGATLTREISVALPAGEHRVLFPIDISILDQGPPRLTAEGSYQLGELELLSRYIVNPEAVFSDEQLAAKNRLDTAQDSVVRQSEVVSQERAALNAASARIDFLKSMTGGSLQSLDAEAVTATVALIGEGLLQAERARLSAEQAMRAAQKELEVLQTAFEQAETDFERLYPPKKAIDMLAVSVVLDQPETVELTLKHLTERASWAPDYDLHLTRGEKPSVKVDRKVVVYQATDELWNDVALTLSTANPFAGIEPSTARGTQAIIQAPIDARIRKSQPMASSTGKLDYSTESVEFEGEPFVVEELTASAMFDGLSVTYEYPRRISLAPSGDPVLLALDSFEVEAETTQRAIPRRDDTAFLVADLRNARDEPILPGDASVYRDGVFVGRTSLDLIPAGGEGEVSFGPLESIRLSYRALDNDTGDVGVVRRSNTREQGMEFVVENLTADVQSVEALFGLPYAEQEDLDLAVNARPAPDETNQDKERGLALWNLELVPGEKRTVSVDVEFNWPTDQNLFWQP